MITPDPKPPFPSLDYHSTEWSTFKEALNDLIVADTKRLLTEDDPIASAKLRGSLATLNKIVGWEKRKAEHQHRQQ